MSSTAEEAKVTGRLTVHQRDARAKLHRDTAYRAPTGWVNLHTMGSLTVPGLTFHITSTIFRQKLVHTRYLCVRWVCRAVIALQTVCMCHLPSRRSRTPMPKHNRPSFPVIQPQAALHGEIDPVCGMTVDPQRAASTHVHAGRTYYFCSASCAATFQAEPER